MNDHDERRMTVSEFKEHLRARVDAFVAAVAAHQAAGEEGFVGAAFELRTETDWLREMAAYEKYVELESELAYEQATDRRRHTYDRRGFRVR